ncbi:MAG: M20 family metallopeptidase [Planctomycetaceae bacterium]|nr:M20 family metallopeptidase [Planctomycetaceae bacterium]
MQALDYARQLVTFDSVSRVSNVPVTDAVEAILRRLGFEIERIEYDDENGIRKANLIAKKGTGTGGMAYFAHTDVVPADTWAFEEHGPFVPTVKEGRLYGRGSCDMKGSIACMLAAVERIGEGDLTHPVYVTCTADEEIGYGGATYVAEQSQLFAEMVAGEARGIVGEPTVLEIVHAHKGVIGLRATSRGRAAHSSTGEGVNANLAMIPYLAEMKAIHDETAVDPRWRNEDFHPPTVTWNIGINDFTRATNITPPQSVCTVYFRPMPGMDAELLIERAKRKAEECGLEFVVVVRGRPLRADPGSPFVRECLEVAGKERSRTVAYGTDGGKLTDLRHMIVCGPGDIRQAHTHDEWISLEQLDLGTDLYERMIRRWSCSR